MIRGFLLRAGVVILGVVVCSLLLTLVLTLVFPGEEAARVRLPIQVFGGFAIGWYATRLTRGWLFPAPKTLQFFYTLKDVWPRVTTARYVRTIRGVRHYTVHVKASRKDYREGFAPMPMESELTIIFDDDLDVVVEKDADPNI